MIDRAPELAPLQRKRVGIVGLGCVGAAGALELLRAGVGTIRIMDPDIVDAGTLVRWPFGIRTVGQPKIEVIQGFASANYPFSSVEGFRHRIGDVFLGDPTGHRTERSLDRIPQFVDGLDLLVDASAEWGVQHFLADLARERRIPFLHMSGTDGGWGGTVFRVVPDRTEGCWYCIRHGIEAGQLPSPPAASEDSRVQPEGCADPTFTGAGFDLSQVSLQGVRLAVATLCSGHGYPDFSWDYAAVSLRAASGESIAPRWETSSVPRNPSCRACGG